MKKHLSLLVLLLSLLIILPVFADAELAPLPEMGEVVSGFEVVEFEDYPDLNGKLVRFVHQETGAELLYLQNDDTNMAFGVSFKTPSISSQGYQHIIEHSVLSSSESYPGKSVFFDLLSRGYLTMINAFTFRNMTLFPGTSTSEKELLNTFDIYLDMLLNPALLTDSKPFEREGIRFELADADAELEPVGVVYNEMAQTASNIETMAYYATLSALFPDTPDHFVSGGLPAEIRTMTYDKLLDYYKSHYTRSNAKIMLYGALDYRVFMDKLNTRFLAGTGKTEKVADPAPQEAFTEPRSAEYAHPATVDTPTEDQDFIDIAFAFQNDISYEERIGLEMLASMIFNHQSFPLYERLMDTGIASDYYAEFAIDTLEPAVVFGATYGDAARAEEFYDTVMDVLRETVETGLDPELVDAIVSSAVLNAKLSAENSQKGLIWMEYTALSWQLRNDPFETARKTAQIEEIASKVDEGFFEDLIQKYFLDNKWAVVLSASPEPGLLEENEAALKEELTARKAAMSEEEIAALVEKTAAFNEWLEGDITPQSTLDRLSVVTVEDLPENTIEFDIKDEEIDGIRYVSTVSELPDVNASSLDFDISGLSAEDMQYLDVYSMMLGSIPTEKYSRSELSLMLTKLFYTSSFSISPRTTAYRSDDFIPDFSAFWIYLSEDSKEAAELINEMFYKTRLDEEVLPEIQDSISGFLSDAQASMRDLRSYAVARGGSQYSPALRFYDYFLYTHFIEFLEKLSADLESDPNAVFARFAEVRDKALGKNKMFVSHVGPEGSLDTLKQDLNVILASVPETGSEGDIPDYPAPPVNEGVKADTTVQYNTLQAPYNGQLEYSTDMMVISTLIRDKLLIPELREKGGAYGGTLTFYNSYLQYLSYQDPHLAETYAVFDEIPAYLRDSGLSKADLDQYLIKTYASFEDTSGTLSRAMTALNNYLIGKTTEDQLNEYAEMKSMTLEDLPLYADKIEAAINGEHSVTAVGSPQMIDDNADMFETISDIR